MWANYEGMHQIIILLVINGSVAIANLALWIIKKDGAKGVVTSLFILVCPIVAPLYLFFSWVVYAVVYKRRADELDRHELSLSKERIQVLSKPNVHAAMDVVPFEEALLVSDKHSIRQLLLDVLKNERQTALASILSAVSHEDSEVSHYAASAISEVVEAFMAQEIKMYQACMNMKEDAHLAKEYRDYVYPYLVQKILSKDEHHRFLQHYAAVLGILHQQHVHIMECEWYQQIVHLFLENQETEQAKVWVERAREAFPEEIDTYKAELLYYYEADKTHFKEVLDRLKASDVVLDQELLDLVRFFQ